MHGRRLSAATRCAGVALAALALTGCGQEQDGPAAQDPSAPAEPSASSGAPDCASVWKDGATLPSPYAGCNSDEGFVATDKLECSSGQRMVRYADHFYAVVGGTIRETESSLERDRGYRGAVASCRA